jgi:hypothetical protein
MIRGALMRRMALSGMGMAGIEPAFLSGINDLDD